jgi:hypothetical protein
MRRSTTDFASPLSRHCYKVHSIVGGTLQVVQLHLISYNHHLVILQRLQSNLEFDLKVPMSSFLISLRLRYDILTVSSFFHHLLELLAPSLDSRSDTSKDRTFSFVFFKLLFSSSS